MTKWKCFRICASGRSLYFNILLERAELVFPDEENLKALVAHVYFRKNHECDEAIEEIFKRAIDRRKIDIETDRKLWLELIEKFRPNTMKKCIALWRTYEDFQEVQ